MTEKADSSDGGADGDKRWRRDVLRVAANAGTSNDISRGGSDGLAEKAVHGALIGEGLRYTTDVKAALDRGAKKVNQVGKQWGNCKPAVLAGHTAEADHAATFNIDAGFQGKRTRAVRLASNKSSAPT